MNDVNHIIESIKRNKYILDSNLIGVIANGLINLSSFSRIQKEASYDSKVEEAVGNVLQVIAAIFGIQTTIDDIALTKKEVDKNKLCCCNNSIFFEAMYCILRDVIKYDSKVAISTVFKTQLHYYRCLVILDDLVSKSTHAAIIRDNIDINVLRLLLQTLSSNLTLEKLYSNQALVAEIMGKLLLSLSKSKESRIIDFLNSMPDRIKNFLSTPKLLDEIIDNSRSYLLRLNDLNTFIKIFPIDHIIVVDTTKQSNHVDCKYLDVGHEEIEFSTGTFYELIKYSDMKNVKHQESSYICTIETDKEKIQVTFESPAVYSEFSSIIEFAVHEKQYSSILYSEFMKNQATALSTKHAIVSTKDITTELQNDTKLQGSKIKDDSQIMKTIIDDNVDESIESYPDSIIVNRKTVEKIEKIPNMRSNTRDETIEIIHSKRDKAKIDSLSGLKTNFKNIKGDIKKVSPVVNTKEQQSRMNQASLLVANNELSVQVDDESRIANSDDNEIMSDENANDTQSSFTPISKPIKHHKSTSKAVTPKRYQQNYESDDSDEIEYGSHPVDAIILNIENANKVRKNKARKRKIKTTVELSQSQIKGYLQTWSDECLSLLYTDNEKNYEELISEINQKLHEEYQLIEADLTHLQSTQTSRDQEFSNFMREISLINRECATYKEQFKQETKELENEILKLKSKYVSSSHKSFKNLVHESKYSRAMRI